MRRQGNMNLQIINICIIAIIGVGGSPLYAAPSQISSGIKISFPTDPSLLPGSGLNNFFGKVMSGTDAILIQIRNGIPQSYAHEVIVKKYWNKQILEYKKLGEKNLTSGCVSKGKYLFLCSRSALTAANLNVFEMLIWDNRKELISIRVSSNNKKSAETYFKGIKWGYEK